MNTVKHVLERMEQTLKQLHSSESSTPASNCFPFLYTYYLVTKRVYQADRQEHLFQHTEALQKLDIYFARQYFDPLQLFLSSDIQNLIPWQTHYEYANTPKARAFVLTLLGINAHINGDLPIALAQTNYVHETDFNQVDQLLSSVVSPLMKFLAKQYFDPQALGGVLFPHWIQKEFYQTVIRWRHQAWENSQKITPQNLVTQKKVINQQTEQVAHELIRIFDRPVYSLCHFSEAHQLKVVLP